MKVKELIILLQALDPEKEVYNQNEDEFLPMGPGQISEYKYAECGVVVLIG